MRAVPWRWSGGEPCRGLLDIQAHNDTQAEMCEACWEDPPDVVLSDQFENLGLGAEAAEEPYAYKT